MSRWTRPISKAWCRPRAAWRTYSHASATGSGPFARTIWVRSVPSISSMTQKWTSPTWSASYAATTFGWDIWASAWISCAEAALGGRVGELLPADDLHRHVAAEPQVVGLEHPAHAALAEQVHEDVRAERQVPPAALEDLLDLERGEPAAAVDLAGDAPHVRGVAGGPAVEIDELVVLQQAAVADGAEEAGRRLGGAHRRGPRGSGFRQGCCTGGAGGRKVAGSPGPSPPHTIPGMKYAIVIPDGCADEPARRPRRAHPAAGRPRSRTWTASRGSASSGGRTTSRRRSPRRRTWPRSRLFGYDPLKVYTGRAPLETAAMGIHLGPNDWAVRCNLVYVPDGHMRDFTAGHIPSEDGRRAHRARSRTNSAAGRSAAACSNSTRASSTATSSSGAGKVGPCPLEGTKCQPPHDIPDQPVADHLPQGPGRDMLVSLMEASKPILADHPVNKRRIAEGKKPATQVWLWGQGKAPSRRAVRGDLRPAGGDHLGRRPGPRRRRAARLAPHRRARRDRLPGHRLRRQGPVRRRGAGRVRPGLRPRRGPGRGLARGPGGREGEGPGADRRARRRPAARRPAAVTATGGSWSSRTTARRCATRAHAYGAVPFAAAGTGIAPAGQASYDEPTAAAAVLSFDPGWGLMKWFLG